MTLTDEQLELAARELCKEDGINPNEYKFFIINWSPVADEIKRWLQIQEAVDKVIQKELETDRGTGEVFKNAEDLIKSLRKE